MMMFSTNRKPDCPQNTRTFKVGDRVTMKDGTKGRVFSVGQGVFGCYVTGPPEAEGYDWSWGRPASFADLQPTAPDTFKGKWRSAKGIETMSEMTDEHLQSAIHFIAGKRRELQRELDSRKPAPVVKPVWDSTSLPGFQLREGNAVRPRGASWFVTLNKEDGSFSVTGEATSGQISQFFADVISNRPGTWEVRR